MAVEFPADVKDLRRHAQLYTAIRLVSAVQKPATETEVLAGRCHTRHLLPTGTIVEVKPPMTSPFALKRNDVVKLRIVREIDDVMHVPGTVSWVRPKVFLPDGVAVSCVGVDFDVLAADVVRALERFIERLEPPRHVVSFASIEVMAREYEQNLKVGGVMVPGTDAPERLTRTRVRLALPAGAAPPGQPPYIDVEVEVVFAGPTGWGGQLVSQLSEDQRAILSGAKR